MPLNPHADAEVTAFSWVPPFAAGLVRDLRVRWALEEAGRHYRVRLIDVTQPRPAEYFLEQPFGQVPAYRDSCVQLFESGAILIHLASSDNRLLPTEHAQRMRAIAWVIAALNSIEPMIFELINIDIFNPDQGWAKQRRPEVVEKVQKRLKLLSEALGDKQWLEGRFSIGDLMMVSVLRSLRHTALVAEQPNLAMLVARAEARPAFQQALADQLAAYSSREEAA